MLFFHSMSFSPSKSRCKYLQRYQTASTCSALLFTLAASTMARDAYCAPLPSASFHEILPSLRSQAVLESYQLGPDDVLDVQLSNHPLLNRTLTVRPDGKITFPRVGDVQVTGLTTTQLAAKLKTQLERTLNNVRIEVEVKTARPRLARIVGPVKLPSSYDIKPGWRAVDLIAAAGGLSAKVARVSGRIIRGNQTLPFDVGAAMARPNSTANLAVQPGDLLSLEESTVPYQVTVSGNVGKAGPYDLEDGLTLPKLLARAGGTTTGAALKEAQVVRNGQTITIDISPDQLQDPTSEAARFALQQGDVLTVPQNKNFYILQGRVAQPNLYPLPENPENATMLRLLTEAGGALPDADLKHAVVTHTVNGVQERTTVDLSAVQQGLAPDTHQLQDGDILLIPRKDDQVHVLGQVGKAGVYELTDKMNLLSLLSEAGSSTSNTGLAKAYVQRGQTQIPVDLNKALNKGDLDPEIAQFKLQAGDVLVIPDVTIPQITISGEVARPGLFKLDNNASVAALLAQAGNGTDDALYSKAYVQRGDTRIPLNLNPFLPDGTPNAQLENFQFEEGDVLTVPKNEVQYAVMGQVGKPGQYAYPDDLKDATVLNVLAKAGGPVQAGSTGGANLKDATIVRIVNNQPTTIPINIDALFQKNSKAAGDNVVLQPGDVLFIPPKKAGFSFGSVLGPLSALSLLLR